MFIEHKQYLALLDQIDYLRKDNNCLREQKALLTSKLLRQQEQKLKLEENDLRSIKMIEQLHAQELSYHTQNKKQIINKITQIDQTTKQFLENKFTNLEHSALTQVQAVELRNTKTKLGFYQLTDFANKLRNMYKQTLGIENFKGKKQPSLLDLLKWIKSMPGVAVNMSSTGFSSTMSMSSSKLRKNGSSKYKLKENRSVINFAQSNSRVKF